MAVLKNGSRHRRCLAYRCLGRELARRRAGTDVVNSDTAVHGGQLVRSANSRVEPIDDFLDANGQTGADIDYFGLYRRLITQQTVESTQ